MNNLPIDLTLQPTTLDLWHVGLAGVAALFLLLFMIALIGWLAARRRARKPVKPEIKVVEKRVEVEKIVEVEKRVQAPAPEPIILKQATDDAALQLLAILQKEARFIDFVNEDMTAYSDADIGAAARIVHQGCSKALQEHFVIAPVSTDAEGSRLTLNPGFDAAAFRLTGNIVGEAPFQGVLIHKGWKITRVDLPKLTEGHDPSIIAPAEVEL